MNKKSLAYSTCPNDTFIFHAMVSNSIDTEGYIFSPYLADVEDLNQAAFEKRFHITKLSAHAYLKIRDTYTLLDSGAALGYGVGPLIVTKKEINNPASMKIAVPGVNTTAFLLLRLWNPEITDIHVERFDRIMPAVEKGHYDAGLIIHEGRFVYPQHGLVKLIDLGQWWEETTQSPIPLGCIALRKDENWQNEAPAISRIIRRSLEYARSNPGASANYIKSHAQELEGPVIEDHINLYVNDFSLSLGEEGHRAMNLLESMALERGIL